MRYLGSFNVVDVSIKLWRTFVYVIVAEFNAVLKCYLPVARFIHFLIVYIRYLLLLILYITSAMPIECRRIPPGARGAALQRPISRSAEARLGTLLDCLALLGHQVRELSRSCVYP